MVGLYWITVIQFLILGLLFYIRPTGKKAINYSFGHVLIIMALLNLDFPLKASGLFVHVPFLGELTFVATWLFGVFYYRFIKNVVGSPVYAYRSPWFLLQLLPAFLLLLYLGKYFLLDDVEKMSYVNEISSLKVRRLDYAVIYLVFFALTYFFLIRSLIVLKRVPRDKKGVLNTARLLTWIHMITLGLCLVFIITDLEEYAAFIPLTILPIYLFVIYTLVSGQTFPDTLKSPTEPISEELKDIYAQVYSAITATKLYCEPSLDLTGLSREIGLPSYKISKAINQVEETNFNDFINRLRVDEAKKLLSDEEFANYTIDAIGEEAGFKSRTSFTAAFKKYLGTTPGSYRSNKG